VTAPHDEVVATLEAVIVFLDEEADQRSNAGGLMSDYEDEPKKLLERCEAAIELIKTKMIWTR
jgi:hypothetical protein